MMQPPQEEVGCPLVQKNPRRGRMNGFEEWGGYMAAKKMKLDKQFEQQKPIEMGNAGMQVSDIFKGISIYVNGYTKPSAEELKRMMMLHGGIYHYYYSTNTSHMIATNLPDSKIKSLKGRKIVLPDWITDSIKAGKLLPDINYLLYTPEITDHQHRLQLTKLDNQRMVGVSDDGMAFLGIANTDSNNLSAMGNIVNQTVDNSGELAYIQNDKLQMIHSNDFSFSNFVNETNTSPNSKSTVSNNGLAIKAGHPDFISEFYNHSRLHHISTAGQELKLYVQQLAYEQKGKSFLGRELLKLQTSQCSRRSDVWEVRDRRVVMHLDMDCFFVSVGLRNHPELRGQPVAVTHSKGKQVKPQQGSSLEYEANYYARRFNSTNLERVNEENENSPKISKYSSDYGSLSEVASCSYEARQAGVKNGMFLGEAMRRCPGLKTIPYDFDGYNEVSKLLYDTVASYTLDIEAVSCDELYIDCTELLQDVKISPSEFATILRNEIYAKTGCTASAGVGGNMLLARLTTKVAKPNNQYVLLDNQVMEFMKKQLVKDLPGVGYSTSAKLLQFGVKTCADLQTWSLGILQQEFGSKTGQTLYEHCRGIDNRSVTLEKDRKSVSAEINYGIRFEQEHEIYAFINDLASEVQQRLKKIDRKGRSLTLKLRIRKEDAPMQTAKFMGHGVCDSICKSVVLKTATDDARLIGQECCSLARSLRIQPHNYRGLGIQVGKLELSVKDSTVKTMEHFLSKKVEGSDQTTALVQVPVASSTTDAIQRPMDQTTNLAGNASNLNQLSVPLTQSAYYAQISDMDKSVLDALPEELRREILAAACPERQENPNKPLVKVTKPVPVSKRGRPTGTKSKKGKSKSPQKTIKDYQTISTSGKSVLNCTKKAKPKANLSGATEINEVRELVKEWVQSTEEPGEEDIEHFKNYLVQLTEENLENTDLVLKQFYRLASSANQYWKDSYFLILSYVQQKMLQDFGYMLKASDSFD